MPVEPDQGFKAINRRWLLIALGTIALAVLAGTISAVIVTNVMRRSNPAAASTAVPTTPPTSIQP